MKVYVNKDKDGKYIAENYEHLYDLRYAEMFNDYEIALCYCPLDCEVVEVQLMETTELQDYTKQVRKEVKEEIAKNVSVVCINGVMYASYSDLEKILYDEKQLPKYENFK